MWTVGPCFVTHTIPLTFPPNHIPWPCVCSGKPLKISWKLTLNEEKNPALFYNSFAAKIVSSHFNEIGCIMVGWMEMPWEWLVKSWSYDMIMKWLRGRLLKTGVWHFSLWVHRIINFGGGWPVWNIYLLLFYIFNLNYILENFLLTIHCVQDNMAWYMVIYN